MTTPLKQRPFLILLLAQFFSDMGNWFDVITLGVIITYRWQMGPAAMAALTIAFGLPWVFLGPLLSVYAGRLPKKAVMLSCCILRGLIVIGLIFVHNLYALLILVLLKETIGALYDPVHQGAIHDLVPKEGLLEASSLSQLSVNTSKIIAPIIGGVIISFSGASTVFLMEAIGFFIAASFISQIHTLIDAVPQKQGEAAEGDGFWNALKKGFSYIHTNKILKMAISLSSARLFLIFLYDSILIIWARNLGFNESLYSTMISSIGFGSVLGVVVAGRWKGWGKKPVLTMCGASIFSGGLVLLIGLMGFQLWPVSIYMGISIFLLLGLVGAAVSVSYGYIIQTETSSDLMGRVVGSANAIQNFSMLCAPSVGAFVAKAMGVNAVFVIAGVCISLLGASILVQNSRRSTGEASGKSVSF